MKLPAAPVYAGHTFKGWFTQRSGGASAGGAGASYALRATVTLYAHWSTSPSTAAFNRLATIHTFSLESSTLSDSMKAQIKGVVRELVAQGDRQVRVVGYASTPITSTEEHLAASRADAVERLLKSDGAVGDSYSIAVVDGDTSADLIVVVYAR